MPTFLTPGRHGYAVRFSRTRPDTIAVATSQYYGLAGGGTLFFLELSHDSSTILELQKLEWSDGLFDVVSIGDKISLYKIHTVAWSGHEIDRLTKDLRDCFTDTLKYLSSANQRVSWSDFLDKIQTWSGGTDGAAACGAGDGAVIVFRMGCAAPLRVLRGHTSEVCSVDWPRAQLLSASWDTSVKLWDPESEACLSTFAGHSQLVYTAAFSPHSPSTFASVSGDGHLKLWSCGETGRAAAAVKAHDAEVLSCDWSRTETHAIATAGSDGLVRGWDLRRLTSPMFTLKGCECAVRRVQFSPHSPSVVAAVSYDFTTRIWDLKGGCEPLETIRHHSEFTYGLDWSCLRPHQLADCGWDSLVHVFTPRSLA